MNFNINLIKKAILAYKLTNMAFFNGYKTIMINKYY